MVVAAPTGSVEAYPKQEQLVAFKVPHGVFIKMKQGTWHAGVGLCDTCDRTWGTQLQQQLCSRIPARSGCDNYWMLSIGRGTFVCVGQGGPCW